HDSRSCRSLGRHHATGIRARARKTDPAKPVETGRKESCVKDTLMIRKELKLACLALLDDAAVEHPSGHQGKSAARYILRSENDDRIELMFEKGENSRANL